MNEAIEDLVEPETILSFAIFIKIADLASVQDVALSAQGSYRAQVGMHRCVDKTGVVVVATNIPWSVKPIDSE